MILDSTDLRPADELEPPRAVLLSVGPFRMTALAPPTTVPTHDGHYCVALTGWTVRRQGVTMLAPGDARIKRLEAEHVGRDVRIWRSDGMVLVASVRLVGAIGFDALVLQATKEGLAGWRRYQPGDLVSVEYGPDLRLVLVEGSGG